MPKAIHNLFENTSQKSEKSYYIHNLSHKNSQKYQKPYSIHKLRIILAKNPKSAISTTFSYNIFLGWAKYRNWWKPGVHANAVIKPVSYN
jgi:hypothetical protein